MATPRRHLERSSRSQEFMLLNGLGKSRSFDLGYCGTEKASGAAGVRGFSMKMYAQVSGPLEAGYLENSSKVCDRRRKLQLRSSHENKFKLNFPCFPANVAEDRLYDMHTAKGTVPVVSIGFYGPEFYCLTERLRAFLSRIDLRIDNARLSGLKNQMKGFKNQFPLHMRPLVGLSEHSCTTSRHGKRLRTEIVYHKRDISNANATISEELVQVLKDLRILLFTTVPEPFAQSGTENLTCRFIQLRKENGEIFTGRKYSAQAGWKYILREMRHEFPTIMANVHYTVLKKKWSNLLQQYKIHVDPAAKENRYRDREAREERVRLGNKCLACVHGQRYRAGLAWLVLLLCICHSDLLKELRNPVHGDRNKADDVSWPFYSAIDELLGGGHDRGTPNYDEYIDPHEFLCVSVTPEEPTSSVDAPPTISVPETQRRANDFHSEPRMRTFGGDGSVQIERIPSYNTIRQIDKNQGRRKRVPSSPSIPRLPRATELTIKKVTSEADCSKDLSRVRRNDPVDSTRDKGRVTEARNEDEERPRKLRRTQAPYREDHESRTDRRIEQIFEYIKQRDEENRSIMIRVMHAVETIANKL